MKRRFKRAQMSSEMSSASAVAGSFFIVFISLPIPTSASRFKKPARLRPPRPNGSGALINAVTSASTPSDCNRSFSGWPINCVLSAGGEPLRGLSSGATSAAAPIRALGRGRPTALKRLNVWNLHRGAQLAGLFESTVLIVYSTSSYWLWLQPAKI